MENALETQRLEQLVQEHTVALETYRFHLEELVVKRTAELNNINDKLRMEISQR